MGNNPLWKRKLQDLIDANNGRHGRKAKGVSHKTMQERASSLFRAFGLLRRLGYPIDPANLAGRHVGVLVDYWTCNERVAELCRRHAVVMLPRAHSAAYIQQQLSFLRVYASAWIGKPGMVRPLAHYVDGDARFKRSLSAARDRSWEGNGVDFEAVVAKVAAIDERVAAQLALLLAFGLRRKEAVMFTPRTGIVNRDQVPGAHDPCDRYAAFLRIERGTKGGRLRFVAIRSEEQRAALDRALRLAPYASSHLGHPGLSLRQSLKRFDNVVRTAGVTRKQLGVTAHGLRHQFAQELHVELTDVAAPIRGGGACDDVAALKSAWLEIARQLGHNRACVSGAYLGSPRCASQAEGGDDRKEEPA